MRICFFSILFSLSLCSAHALEVFPNETDKNIRTVKGPHQVYAAKTRGSKVLITIGGTNSHPADFKNVHQWAWEKGYNVLGIDYDNEVSSVVCQSSTDYSCYDDYRSEIVFGQSLSDLVKVNESNSIAHRILKLFLHLRWNVDWENVVLVGHSQGAGHAAYLAKHFQVSKVIMTGGPHDYYPNHGPADWTLERGDTDPSKFFAFLHWKDFFGTEASIGSARVLMGELNASVVKITDEIPAGSKGQIFISDLPFPDPHNSFTSEKYKKVWDFLLK